MKKGTFRKIVALGTGLTMLGATIFGATAAADLSQYPSPLFIQNGVFNGDIIVGKLATTDDVLGSIGIATSLQTAAVKLVPIAGAGGLTATVDKESAKMHQTGREMTYGTTITSAFGSVIDFSDLPTLLAQTTFKDNEGSNKDERTATQTIEFPTGKLEYKQSSTDFYNQAADNYLWWDSGSNNLMNNYTLSFDTGVTYDNSTSALAQTDMENNAVEMQGNTYTITDVALTNGQISKMELLAGKTVVWMTQGEPLKKTIDGAEHTVTLQDVSEIASDGTGKCGITVDGTTMWIDKGSTEIINGVQVGVTDAITVHSAAKDTDVCQVNIGASKVTIENGQRVKVNDVEVEGSKGYISAQNPSGSNAGWGGLSITYYSSGKKEYLKEGTTFADPVLGNFQFDFAGMTKVTEDVSYTGGSSPQLSFLNYDGKTIDIPWRVVDTTSGAVTLGHAVLGDDVTDRMLIGGDVYKCGTTPSACEGTRILYVTSGHVAHILELSSVNTDVTPNTVSFNDVTYGTEYNSKQFTPGTSTGVTLGSLGGLTMGITADGNMSVTAAAAGGPAMGASPTMFTKYKSIISLQQALDYNFGNTALTLAIQDFVAPAFSVTEPTTDTLAGSGVPNPGKWILNATYSSTDRDFNWNTPLFKGGAWNVTGLSKDHDTYDTRFSASEWGTIVQYDTSSNGNGDGKLSIPEDQAYGNGFVDKVGAVVTTATGGGYSSVPQQIQVSAAKKDTDIEDVAAQNLIVVGGPCANSVASRLMGITDPTACAAKFKEGEAIIQLFSQSNGNVAVLVAGMTALDTQRASKVLANYKDYAKYLTGTEVKVMGTTLSDITVSAVTP